ncbi:MAG: RNA methyltransferase [Pseudomonadota bacterium]
MGSAVQPEKPMAEVAAPFTILVAPQMGQNIGAAARAMLNFGLDRMRLVAPRDGWPNPAAVATASGAGTVLDDARVFATTAEAVADCAVVYATTARPRELTKRVLTPEAAMREAAAHIADGTRVGILYGGERAGLANADIVGASAIVTVPVNPGFASLNLAQCVLLVSYEWRRATVGAPAEVLSTGKSALADKGDVTVMLDHLVAELEAAHFFFPEHKRPSMEANLRNLFERQSLTDQDVRTLFGVLRALADGPKRRRVP